MRTAVLALAVLIATPAFAQEAPQSTAALTAAPPAMSVADQIDAFLRTSPAAAIDDGVPGVVADDRKVHGEVAVGIGTGGYRSFYMRSDMPVGESGRLSVAFADTRSARWGGHRGVGADLRFGGGPGLDRQRCDIEGMTPPRPLDSTFGGPNGRCVRPLVP